MPRGKKLKVVFKQDYRQQGMLIPLDLNDMVAPDHPVRVVNAVLDRVDITDIIKQFRPGGTSSYHPRMLLKVIVFGYINNIYSSRKIEEAVKSNIHFMWLAGMRKPDHNTINRFRGQRLQKTLKPIFNQVVLMLYEEGLLNIRDLYTDGTKIEANANRYTFVWGKAIKTNRDRIITQLDELWKYALGVAAAELEDTDPPGSGHKKISSEAVNKTIEQINAALKDKDVDGQVRQKLNYAKKHWPAALDKYEEQEKLLGQGRNSYSKTDPDATFMRMKDDHMRNGQLKPAYNVQISTNNQFIASYSVHQKTTDTTTLKTHLSEHIKSLGVKPSCVTADAGYGSEENYQWLKNKRITAYVKDRDFDKNQQKASQNKKLYKAEHFIYEEQKDKVICPQGHSMKNIGIRERITATGFKQDFTRYRTTKCSSCLLQTQCNNGNRTKTIELNHNLNRLRTRAAKRLNTKKGIQKRKRRCYDVEPVFAAIKHNHRFNRFMLRGIDKVNVETGLLALAHNLRKKVA
jgi:transposase